MDSGEKDYVQDPSTGNPGSLYYLFHCEGQIDEVAEVERKRMRMLLRKPDEDTERSQERYLSFIHNMTNTQEKTQEATPSPEDPEEAEAAKESDKAKETVISSPEDQGEPADPDLTVTLSLPENEKSVGNILESLSISSPEVQQEATSYEQQNVPEMEKRNSSDADRALCKELSPEGAQANVPGTSQTVPPGQRTAATVLHEIFKDVPEDPRPCTDGYIPLTNYIKGLNPAVKCQNQYESVEELKAAMVKISKCLRLREGSKLKREDIFKGFLPEYPAEPGYIERRYRHLLKQPEIPEVVKMEPMEQITSGSSSESENTVIYRPLTGSVVEYDASNSMESPGNPIGIQEW